MTKAQMQKIRKFVAENIGEFHSDVLAKVQEKQLDEFLKGFNPYMFKAKAREDAHDFIKLLLDDFLRRSEGTKFGQFLEKLAIFVGGELYGARKSIAKGIDLEFTRGGVHYAVSVKSSPNWGNKSQTKQQKDDFVNASRLAGQAGRGNKLTCVLGCCYGRKGNNHQGTHMRYCGQEFWQFLSGDGALYQQIVEPLGHQAKRHNDKFAAAYACVLNKMTHEFVARFCDDNGRIKWEEVVKFNSARERPRPPPRKRARKKS